MSTPASASNRSVARHLYDNREQAERAAGVVQRLVAKGLAERYLGSAWTLTNQGKELARYQIEVNGEA